MEERREVGRKGKTVKKEEERGRRTQVSDNTPHPNAGFALCQAALFLSSFKCGRSKKASGLTGSLNPEF